MKFVLDIHGPQMTNLNDFGDLLTFHIVSLAIYPVKYLQRGIGTKCNTDI